MKNIIGIAISAIALTVSLGTNTAFAQDDFDDYDDFNGYQGYYSDEANGQRSANFYTQNSYPAGPGTAITDYEYIEGPRYRSPYAGNNAGEWSYGKDADSPCYHGNYGYNGQTSNYDHSKCVVVYDAQTYVRLLRGSSSMGGTQFFGASGFNGTQGSDSRSPYAGYYANQSNADRNTGHNLAALSTPAGAYHGQQMSASGNNAPAGHSQNANPEGD